MPTKTKAAIVRSSPNLIPEPRSLNLTGGTKSLVADHLIVIESAHPARLLFTAQEAQRALSHYAGITWHIHASESVPADDIGLALVVDSERGAAKAQGYKLSINPDGIKITGADDAGLYYGVKTLTQLLHQYGTVLPLLEIVDYPDFPARGVMLDISRDKVPTMKTLFELVEMLASMKVNEVQLYTEHTFAYRQHPVVWEHASPMTGEEIMQLDAYCHARYINLVPNQNSFGHMTRWLIHDEYRHLAEAPNGCDTRWGHFDDPFTLCPGDPGSIELVGEMFDDLLPHFTSSMLNVGCDETVDLGAGRSKEECEQKGSGRVYLDFLLKIHKLVKSHNLTMQFWGDIIMEHPELVPDLPKDIIALEWGYEFDHPFSDHGALFAASGVPFYVCPGTSAWNSIGGRTDNAMGNLLNAAENGLAHGAIGYLITDWGDNGHHQPLPVSYLGFAYGAGVSWCLETNRDLDIARATSLHIYADTAGLAGKVAYEMGNVYRLFETRFHNATPYALGTQRPLAQLALKTTKTEIKQALKEIDRLAKAVSKLEMERADGDLVQSEFLLALSLMRYGLQRLILSETKESARKPLLSKLKSDLKLLTRQYQKIWLARNRPGGLSDSIGKLKLN
jgi:hypothetical protein